MVTVLDIGLLKAFDIVFAFLFVWAIVFAVLQKFKVVGEAVAINALIAVAVAFMVAVSGKAVEIINNMIPWFAVAIIFFILLLLVFMIFGLKESDLGNVVKDKGVYWTLIGVGLMIIAASIGASFGQEFLELGSATSNATVSGGSGSTETGSFQQNILATLFHPKIVGMIVLFSIAIMAVALLTQQ